MRWTVNGSLLAVIPVFLVLVMMKGAFVPTDDRQCQTVRYGVRGMVVDTADNPVSGVWIDVRDQHGDELGRVITNQTGQFYTERLSSTACEKISIRVWRNGYESQRLTYYPPNDGESGEMPYQLSVILESKG